MKMTREEIEKKAVEMFPDVQNMTRPIAARERKAYIEGALMVMEEYTQKQVNSVDLADVISVFKHDDVIEVAERLYYEANPNTKSDVPSFVYEQTEKANKRRLMAQSKLSLYDWCKKFK